MPAHAQEIIQYLQNHPEFFEEQALVLGDIRLRSPYGGRAASLQERQAEMLRDKIKMLEARMMEMIRHGNENALTAEKLQRWTLAMLSTSHASDIPARIVQELQDHFDIPQVAIRLWQLNGLFSDHIFTQGVSEDSKAFASSLSESYCGTNAGFEAVQWLPQPELAISTALLPLRKAGEMEAFGLLLLASPDPQRFHANMGTEFLERIAHIASAALARLL